MTQNSQLISNTFSNEKEIRGNALQQHVQNISTSLIQLLHHFYGMGHGWPEGNAGGWRRAWYKSCASFHMLRKPASIIKNGSLIISIQHQGRQEDGSSTQALTCMTTGVIHPTCRDTVRTGIKIKEKRKEMEESQRALREYVCALIYLREKDEEKKE